MLAAAAVPVTIGLNDGLLKPLVHRTYLGFLTYPSGHTSAVFALAATVTVLLVVPPRPARGGALRILIPAATYAVGVVVAIAVIGLRWHYFTDTVAGAAVGIGTICGLALILDLPAPRRSLTRAAAAWARGLARSDVEAELMKRRPSSQTIVRNRRVTCGKAALVTLAGVPRTADEQLFADFFRTDCSLLRAPQHGL